MFQQQLRVLGEPEDLVVYIKFSRMVMPIYFTMKLIVLIQELSHELVFFFFEKSHIALLPP
jgi:hypothetical protein